MAAESKIDALHQFELKTALGPIGGSVNFTQANVMMLIGAALTLALLYFGMRRRAVVPGRLQSLAELAYTGILSMATGTIGPEGKRFFPFIFALFVLLGGAAGVANVWRLMMPHKRPDRPGA